MPSSSSKPKKQKPHSYPLNLTSLLQTPSKTIFSAYSPKLRVAISFPPDEGRTKQSFKDECDINHIMARYIRTGVLDFTQRNEPRYGDATGIEFQAAANLVARARSMFQELPAELRQRFDNNPAKFLDFVNDESNRAEAEELGLVAAKAPEELRGGKGGSAPQTGAADLTTTVVDGPVGEKPAPVTPPKSGGQGGKANSST